MGLQVGLTTNIASERNIQTTKTLLFMSYFYFFVYFFPLNQSLSGSGNSLPVKSLGLIGGTMPIVSLELI